MNCTCIDTKHKLWWLWLPVLYVAGEFIGEHIAAPDVTLWLISENGPIELFEFFIAALGCILAVHTFFRLDYKTQALAKIMMGIAALGCFYIAGEEISWGQWLLGWQTPEHWKLINDQGETNLHNTSSWLDQKPRILLEIGTVTGGLILPFLIRKRPALIPGWLQNVTPPARLGVVAGLYLLVRLTDIIGTDFHDNPYMRSSEIMESLLFYFTLLYVLYIRERLPRRA